MAFISGTVSNFDQFALVLVGVLTTNYFGQFLAQCLHAFSFGLFHLIAMKVIFQNFSPEQQGRGQALYSTMWGLGWLQEVYWQGIIGNN